MKKRLSLLGGIDFFEPGERSVYKGPRNRPVADLLALDRLNVRLGANGLLQSLEAFLVLYTV